MLHVSIEADIANAIDSVQNDAQAPKLVRRQNVGHGWIGEASLT